MKCPHCGITTEELEVEDGFSQEQCPYCGWVSEVFSTYGDDEENPDDVISMDDWDDCDDDPACMIYDDSEVK